MPILIVKEDVRLKSSENIGLVDPAHEKCFVNMDSPSSKRVQHSQVSRKTTGGNKCRPQGWFIEAGVFLKDSQCSEKFGKWSIGQWSLGMRNFVFNEPFESIPLKNVFGFAIEQHIVSVKRNSQLVTGVYA